MERTYSKPNVGSIISLTASLLMVLCFFLPWIEVNILFGRKLLMGFEFITGLVRRGEGSISLGVSMLSALVATALSIAGLKRSPGGSQTGFGVILAGLISTGSLIFFYLSFFGIFEKATNDPLAQLGQALASQLVTILFGFYGASISSLAVIVGGVLDIAYARKPGRQDISMTASQPDFSLPVGGICPRCGNRYLADNRYCNRLVAIRQPAATYCYH